MREKVAGPRHDPEYPRPWFEVDTSKLVFSASPSEIGGNNYSLTTAQTQVIASSSPTSILDHSPTNASAFDDVARFRQESNTQFGVQATLGASPAVRGNYVAGWGSGHEVTQNKWEITAVPSKGNQKEAIMMWKYVLNEEFRQQGTQGTHTFSPGPSVKFGYKPPGPHVEVELVACWTLKAVSNQRIKQLFLSRFVSKKQSLPPAFTNLLHQISVGIPLNNLTRGNPRVLDLLQEDSQDVSLIGTPFESVETPFDVESRFPPSDCCVSLRRALHGRIEVSRNKRSDSFPFCKCFVVMSKILELQATPYYHQWFWARRV